MCNNLVLEDKTKNCLSLSLSPAARCWIEKLPAKSKISGKMSAADANGADRANGRHFPQKEHFDCGVVPRRVLFCGLTLYPSIFQICCLSYCFIKGIQAFCFSSILRCLSLLLRPINSVSVIRECLVVHAITPCSQVYTPSIVSFF